MRSPFLKIAIVCLLMSLSLSLVQAQEATPAAESASGALLVQVLGQAQTDQDTVTLNAVILDETGAVVPNLTASSFTISDGNDPELRPDAVTTELLRPTALLVVVNMSRGSNLALIQETLRAYFADYYREGDRIIFYILDDTRPANTARVEEPINRAAINRVIDGLEVGVEFYSIPTVFETVEARAQQLRAENSVYNLQVLYVASFLYRNDEAAAGSVFALGRIPFHVVQAHSVHATSTTRMNALATSGGGRFANNRDGQLLALDPTTGAPEAVQELKTLYDTIQSGRLVYQIVYSPERFGQTPERRAELFVRASNGRQGSAQFGYVWQFLPPDVALVSDPRLELVAPVEFSSAGEGRAEALFPVTISVEFPDGTERAVARLTLQITDTTPVVNDALAADRVVCLRVIEAPQPAPDGSYTISCQISDYIVPGSYTPVSVEVLVEDEFGYPRSVIAQGDISVLAPTPVPPTTTPRPTPAPTLSPEELAIASGSAVSTSPLVLGALVITIIVLLALLLFLIRWVMRLQYNRPVRVVHQPVMMPAPAYPANAPAPAPVVDVFSEQKAKVEQENPIYGRLFVLQGIQAQQILIDREEFVIGRSAEQGCHFEINEPYIHPRHCVLIHRRGKFMIKDLGSKNGTFVDGERLPIEREVPLPFRSELSITRSVRLELREPDAEYVPSEGSPGLEQRPEDTTIGELRFKPLLKVTYRDDGEQISGDYKPL